MANTYDSTQLLATGGNARSLAGTGHGMGGDLKGYYWTIALPLTPTWATGDAFNFGYVPNGFRALFATIYVDGIDSSTGLVFSIGDVGSTNRLFSSLTLGRSSTVGISNDMNAASFGFKYTTASPGTLITMTLGTIPTTQVAGNISLLLAGRIEGVAD